MTFTSKISESTIRVPFGWDVIEAGEDVSFKSEPASKPSFLFEEFVSGLLLNILGFTFGNNSAD